MPSPQARARRAKGNLGTDNETTGSNTIADTTTGTGNEMTIAERAERAERAETTSSDNETITAGIASPGTGAGAESRGRGPEIVALNPKPASKTT